MNGANVLPCISTTNPPKITIAMMMGNSQYFFRARMKATSSKKKDMFGKEL